MMDPNATPIQTFCVIDGRAISPERAKMQSVTCSRECATLLAKFRRALINSRHCSQCHKPSTPEERASYARWKRETERVKMGRPKKVSEQ